MPDSRSWPSMTYREADIAVVIPCHNGAHFLARAIDSALVQTRPASTIYVVDDASTDETPAIAARYAGTYPNVRFIRLGENVGPASARNAAITRATEAYIALLDADDYWLPEHLAVLAGLLDDHTSAGVAFSRVIARGGDPPPAPTVAPGRTVDMLRALLVDNVIPQSASMARRIDILDVGAYREGLRYAEDYDLWLRLALEHEFVYSGRATAVRHLHDGQATRRVKQMANGAWEARERLWRRARHLGHEVSDGVYHACCQAAYELELLVAWRARNRAVLRTVVGLADRVPGGAEQIRRWRWRVRLVWPFWRVAAAIWDRIPEAVRAPLRKRRVRRAQLRSHELRAPQALTRAAVAPRRTAGRH